MKEISYEEWYGLIERITKLERDIGTCRGSIIAVCCLLILLFVGIGAWVILSSLSSNK